MAPGLATFLAADLACDLVPDLVPDPLPDLVQDVAPDFVLIRANSVRNVVPVGCQTWEQIAYLIWVEIPNGVIDRVPGLTWYQVCYQMSYRI